MFKVCLHQKNFENFPYVLHAVDVETKDEAVVKAKEKIAELGYFGCAKLSLQDKVNLLVLDNVVEY